MREILMPAAAVVLAAAVLVLLFLLWRARFAAAIRRQTLERSLAVTTGKVTEQLVPLLPGFAFNPRDVRFLGSPVDLVVFDGLSEGEVRRVVFVEVKTGSAELSARERRVREAVRAGRVEWVEWRPVATGADLP
jgi:predicted Holliday junction resolvase-like endonuclease